MRLTPSGLSGQLGGRRGVPIRSFFTDELASHAATTRLTVLVPAGKVYHLTYLTDLIQPITSGTGTQNRGSTWTMVPSGVAPVTFIEYHTPDGGAGGTWEHYQIRDTWMHAGDSLILQTFDLSTAGVTFYNCQAQIQSYDV